MIYLSRVLYCRDWNPSSNFQRQEQINSEIKADSYMYFNINKFYKEERWLVIKVKSADL